AELVGIAQLVGVDNLVRRDAEGAIDRILVRAAARLGPGPARAAGSIVAGAGQHLAIGFGLAVFFGIGIGAVGRRTIHRGLRPGRGAFTAVALVLAVGFFALALIFVRGRLVELAEIEVEILDQPAGRARIGILVLHDAFELDDVLADLAFEPRA